MITVPDTFTAEECTATFDTHAVPTIEYPHSIVFDQDTLLMFSHFQSWAASKRMQMEPSIAYHAQMDSQSEIVSEEIRQVARACQAEGNE